MKRPRAYHFLFGVAIATLVALSGWWIVFFLRTIQVEHEARLEELRHRVWSHAMRLGHQAEHPSIGVVDGAPELEVVPVEKARPDAREKGFFFAAAPHHPGVGVQASVEALQAVDEHTARRRRMVIGESGLLVALLGVCTFMLYYLVRQENRNRELMESFVAAVTHEMKTPVAGIKSMLQTFAAGRVPAEQAPVLYGMGLKEIARLEHMLENVLLSGRLRTRRYQLEPKPIPVRAFLEPLVEKRQKLLTGHGDSIELSWDVPVPELTMRADPQALQVVLDNLCDNAMKYGGSPARVRVRVRRDEPRKRVSISVEDSGIGFRPEDAERLFEPFRRGLAAETRVQRGTGLGLAIARALTVRMGGTLHAASDGPGKGSVFTVSLEEVVG